MDQYNIGDISQLYVHFLNVLMDENARRRLFNDQSLFSRYDSGALSTDDFFNNLFLRMNCCLECYIISLIYIERLNKAIPGIVNATSLRNIVISSVVLAQKYFDEICYKSEFYASFNQLSVWQINGLEVEFLCRVHFSLAVFAPEFLSFYNRLRALCDASPLRERGVRIPEIVNVAPSGCPLLKYVFSPQEQQRKEAFYRQREQRQAQLRRLPPVPAPILLQPSQPFPPRRAPDYYLPPSLPVASVAPSIPVAPVAPVAPMAPVVSPTVNPYCFSAPLPSAAPVVEPYCAPPFQANANGMEVNRFAQYTTHPYGEVHYPFVIDRNSI